MMRVTFVLSVAAVGCGGGAGDSSPGDSGTTDGEAACVREPAAVDRVRHVVISHPYADASTKSNAWEVLDLLGQLVDKSLVVVGGEGAARRYRFLETIRQYARERLLEVGEAEILAERHREGA